MEKFLDEVPLDEVLWTNPYRVKSNGRFSTEESFMAEFLLVGVLLTTPYRTKSNGRILGG